MACYFFTCFGFIKELEAKADVKPALVVGSSSSVSLQMFSRFVEVGLTVNLAKCKFGKATVTYLGKVVGQGCVHPVRAKVEAIDQFPSPSTKELLTHFLGLLGYYRGFCRNFSTVVAPLTDLLKAKADFIWTSICQEVFEAAKWLTSAPVLAAPKFDCPFRLYLDASNVGSRVVLL